MQPLRLALEKVEKAWGKKGYVSGGRKKKDNKQKDEEEGEEEETIEKIEAKVMSVLDDIHFLTRPDRGSLLTAEVLTAVVEDGKIFTHLARIFSIFHRQEKEGRFDKKTARGAAVWAATFFPKLAGPEAATQLLEKNIIGAKDMTESLLGVQRKRVFSHADCSI